MISPAPQIGILAKVASGRIRIFVNLYARNRRMMRNVTISCFALLAVFVCFVFITSECESCAPWTIERGVVDRKGWYIMLRGLVWQSGDEKYDAATGCGNSRRPATLLSSCISSLGIFFSLPPQLTRTNVHIYRSIHKYSCTQRAGFHPRGEIRVLSASGRLHSGRADCEKIFPLNFINKRMRGKPVCEWALPRLWRRAVVFLMRERTNCRGMMLSRIAWITSATAAVFLFRRYVLVYIYIFTPIYPKMHLDSRKIHFETHYHAP